jgi:hypothetical protein
MILDPYVIIFNKLSSLFVGGAFPMTSNFTIYKKMLKNIVLRKKIQFFGSFFVYQVLKQLILTVITPNNLKNNNE